MPELPEVETVRRGLAPVLAGKRIVRLETRRKDLRFPFPENFAERVEGAVVTALERRAKYLVARLSSGTVLVMHLGMTGRFTIEAQNRISAPGAYVYGTNADLKHDHVVFHVEGGVRVIYNDPRRFGFMLLIENSECAAHPLFRALGSEPLEDGLTATYLATRARGKKVNLKAFLMDQRIVAGLGNIYASEALFRAGLSPDRRASTLASRSGGVTPLAERLVVSIKNVLASAIAAGGSTLNDYRSVDGAAGTFQETFAVYDRAGAPCTKPGCKGTVRRKVHANRATFYCTVCQR